MNPSSPSEPSLDGLLNALRSAATPEELSGEATAISAMASAIADSSEGTTSMSPTGQRNPLTRPTFSRARRIVGLTAIGVLGIAGVAAAGAGVFVPDNRPKVEHVPGTDDNEDNQDTDDTASQTTIADDESVETSLPEDTAVETSEDNESDEVKAAADTTLVGDTTPADGSIVCAEGNHGMTVSSVAHATPPGPGHGEAVSAAAHSDCGKDSTDDTTVDTAVDASLAADTTIADTDDNSSDPGSQGNGHKPNDPGSKGKGHGHKPSNPATGS